MGPALFMVNLDALRWGESGRNLACISFYLHCFNRVNVIVYYAKKSGCVEGIGYRNSVFGGYVSTPHFNFQHTPDEDPWYLWHQFLLRVFFDCFPEHHTNVPFIENVLNLISWNTRLPEIAGLHTVSTQHAFDVNIKVIDCINAVMQHIS